MNDRYIVVKNNYASQGVSQYSIARYNSKTDLYDDYAEIRTAPAEQAGLTRLIARLLNEDAELGNEH